MTEQELEKRVLAGIRAIAAALPSVTEIEENWRAPGRTAVVEGQSFCWVDRPKRRPAPKFTTQDEETPR